MKIAFVHDYLVHLGGAERVLLEFHKIWPDAPIFTLLHNPRAIKGVFDSCTIHTSFLQNFPLAKTRHRFYPVLMPMAIEQFDFSDFDVVLSSSTSFAKGVITPSDTLHVCYCHTPMRYVWDDSHHVIAQFRSFRPVRKLLPFALNYLRLWDGVSSSRVDSYIANSENVRNRIQKYYRRDSRVICPPVDDTRLMKDVPSGDRDDFLLMVGRLLPYKGFDIGIRVAAILQKPLVIIGDGSERMRLQRLASNVGANVKFLLHATDDDVASYMGKARVLLFPGEEDFGIVPLEAMLFGCPVVAYQRGGAKETVLHKKTGVLVDSQDPEDFAKAVRECLRFEFDVKVLRIQAQKFSAVRFRKEIREFVQQACS